MERHTVIRPSYLPQYITKDASTLRILWTLLRNKAPILSKANDVVFEVGIVAAISAFGLAYFGVI